ncbi:Leucine rich repeat-containing protein [Lachnospiraceae bacterium XBB1006]|nr:Leucine rich repeat-containing protein [Lachnospiraceae bacterium XBB1006]
MNKISKQVIAFLCTFALVLTALPAGVAKAANTVTDYTYKSVDGKTIEITGYNGSDSMLVIPSTIDNKPVTTISAAAFRGKTQLTGVLTASITTIKDSAFSGCTQLTSFWGTRLTSIGDSAFEDCTRLNSVSLPNGCTQIGADAFVNCSNLLTMDIPASVTTFGSHCLGFIRTGTTYTVNPGFSMSCTTNSPAMQYAKTNGIRYTSNTCDHLGMIKIPAKAATETTDGNYEYYYCPKCQKYFKDNAGTKETTVIAETIPKASTRDLRNAVITPIADQYYTGKDITPAVTVRYGTTTLSPLTDYTVTYLNNQNVGTATVTITGKGNYSGSQIATFRIIDNSIVITAKDHYFSYNEKERSFTIKATTTPAADLKYTSDSEGITIKTKKKLTGNVGELVMDAGFSGTATITITATKANYRTATKTITVFVPSATRLTQATRTGATSATVVWSANSMAQGYTLQYSTSEKFTIDPQEISFTGTSGRIKGLTKNQVYYVRIRTILEVNGNEYYSKWSASKRIEGSVAPSLLYERYLSKQAAKVSSILSYTLCDLNGDGVDELLYKYYNGGNRNCGKICTIIDGTVKMIKNQKDGSPNFYRNSKNEIMMDSSNSSREKLYRVYQMTNGKMKLLRTYRSTVNQDGKYSYTVNGKKIKKSEFKKMKKEFKKLKMTTYQG